MELRAMMAELEAAEAELEAAREQHRYMAARLEQYHKEYTDLLARYQHLVNDNKLLEKEKAKLGKKIADRKAKLEESKAKE